MRRPASTRTACPTRAVNPIQIANSKLLDAEFVTPKAREGLSASVGKPPAKG
jgi:hypothetical protein